MPHRTRSTTGNRVFFIGVSMLMVREFSGSSQLVFSARNLLSKNLFSKPPHHFWNQAGLGFFTTEPKLSVSRFAVLIDKLCRGIDSLNRPELAAGVLAYKGGSAPSRGFWRW